MPIGESQIV